MEKVSHVAQSYDSTDLHKKFVRLGMMKRKLVNEMLLILPELYNSGIYKKYSKDIFEYAGRFGGIGRSAVEKRLRLEIFLEDKPTLKESIGKVGIHKVSLIAKLATPQNEKAFADKVENMSKSAIQTLSKELRMKLDEKNKRIKEKKQIEEKVGGLFGLSFEGEKTIDSTACRAKEETMRIELDGEMTFLFRKIKNKLGKNLTNAEAMRLMLKNLDEMKNFREVKNVTGDVTIETQEPHEQAKSEQNQAVPGDETSENSAIKSPGDGTREKKNISRYIPITKKRELENNGKCSYPNCNKPSLIFHHRDRFASSKSHDSIIKLCKEHHEFMHNGLVCREQMNEKYWKLILKAGVGNTEDMFYRKFRLNV